VAAIAKAQKKVSATYEFPFVKHAPIGPTMAIGDVKVVSEFFSLFFPSPMPRAGKGLRVQSMTT